MTRTMVPAASSRRRTLARLAVAPALLAAWVAAAVVAGPGPGLAQEVLTNESEPLKPGEYGFVAVTRGQANLVEVFEFAVD